MNKLVISGALALAAFGLTACGPSNGGHGTQSHASSPHLTVIGPYRTCQQFFKFMNPGTIGRAKLVAADAEIPARNKAAAKLRATGHQVILLAEGAGNQKLAGDLNSNGSAWVRLGNTLQMIPPSVLRSQKNPPKPFSDTVNAMVNSALAISTDCAHDGYHQGGSGGSA